MKVLFASSECVPFIKTGGLADVVGALPYALAKQGVEVSVVMPLYREIAREYRENMEHLLYFYLNLGWRRQYCGVQKLVWEGITYYFIDNEYYFGRGYIYGMGGDEAERFAFFSRCALEFMPHVNFQPDIIHCHDWQTALMPMLLHYQYKNVPFFADMKTVFTIHNLQYQGFFGLDYMQDLLYGLPGEAFSADGLELYGIASCMKAGIAYADEITTVSPSYAEEIQSAYYGERLDGLLRSRADHLHGILNGIDVDEYNPATDEFIAQRYTRKDAEAAKAENKRKLQIELGLDENPNAFLIAMVSRLSDQKGIDLIDGVFADIMEEDLQFIVLGNGEQRYVNLFNWAQWKYQGKFACYFGMNSSLAHKVYAASDAFLMPSKFEPCGLSQLISLRYGTLPIVRETGGLKDTVLSYNKYSETGNGFSFLHYNAHDMLHTIRRALRYYNEEREAWGRMMDVAMAGDYGWEKSAEKYAELYKFEVKNGEAGER